MPIWTSVPRQPRTTSETDESQSMGARGRPSGSWNAAFPREIPPGYHLHCFE